MKNRIPFQILRFFLFFFLFSCSSPEHENMVAKVNKATHQLNEIDSLHLKILLSTCDEIVKQPYLENEFKYWELNQPNFENVVLYESELDCGFVGGTCGNTIAVYQKKGEKYKCIYQTCGFNTELSIDVNHGIKSFWYNTKSGEKKIVSWNETSFEEKVIEKNGLDYPILSLISSKMNQKPDSYILDDPNSLDNHHIRVNIQAYQIGKSQVCELYTVKSNVNWYFLIQNKKVLFFCNDILSLERIKSDTTNYFDLKTYKSIDYEIKNQLIDLKPTRYRYSFENKRYESI